VRVCVRCRVCVGAWEPGAGWELMVHTPLYPRYMAGGLKLDEYITHHFTLPQINEAFHLLHEGKTLRAMVHM
jgi:Zn-dependent alcohol dehydrogenase